MIVVVLGMHRSGTSLVSSILHAMGVKMGEPSHLERFTPGSQPHGYWEDQHFLAWNRKIIEETGGHWRTPPPPERIIEAAMPYREGMARLVKWKERAMVRENFAAKALHGMPMWIGWGWKDPRTVLTIEAWWPFIEARGPRIVRVRRFSEGIADSLVRRGDRLNSRSMRTEEQLRTAWAQLADYHWKCTVDFLGLADPMLERCADVRYEDLVHEDTAFIPLNCMARLLGLEGDDYHKAMQAGRARIEFRG